MQVSKNKIEIWDINNLKPYEKNSRTHSPEQIDKLAKSIQEYGFTNPILIDEESGILAGHGRLAAAKKVGLEEVPVVVLTGLTEAQKRAYVIADNKLALDAGWDEKILSEELAILQKENKLESSGFTSAEFDDIFKSLDSDFYIAPKTATTLDTSTIQPTRKYKDGDKVQIGLHTIIVSSTPQNHKINHRADLVIADATNLDKDKALELIQAMDSVAKPATSFYIKYNTKTSTQLRRKIKEKKCNISSTLCVIHDPNKQEGHDFVTRYSHNIYGWYPGKSHNFYGDRKQTTCLELSGTTKQECQELYEYLIKMSSRVGDTVVNLNAKSPAFVIAAHKLHRFSFSVVTPEEASLFIGYLQSQIS